MVPTAHVEPARSGVTFDVATHSPLHRLASAVSPIVDAGANLARTMVVQGGTGLTRLTHQWNCLARRDALGAVLTQPRAAAQWDVGDFFETGRADVDRLMIEIASRVPTLSTRRALDFGCGVGRLTQALA